MKLASCSTALGSQQEVGVVAEVDEAADSHAVALLEVGQGPLDDGLELRRGPQQEAPLDDAAGDLDQMVVVGQVAQLASHARGDGSRPGFLAGFLWHLKLAPQVAAHLKLPRAHDELEVI